MTDKTLETCPGLSHGRLTAILDGIHDIEVGFVGDLCVDIYWTADMKKSELSRETPHFPLPVVSERYQLGAGGNVLANLAALKPKAIHAVSVIGDDWRGMLARKSLDDLHIPSGRIIEIPESTTNAYCKPMRRGISDVVYEDPRLDFTAQLPTPGTQRQIIENLERMAGEVDVICVSDQFVSGCITEAVRQALIRIAQSGKTVVVDSRDRLTEYRNVILKPNELECIRSAEKLGWPGAAPKGKDLNSLLEAGLFLARKLDCGLAVTLGGDGNIQIGRGRAVHIPPHAVEGPIDICGAGDTFLSAFACALAAKATQEEAGQIGSLASEVTIRKLGQTGTASSGEIVGRYEEAYSAALQ